MSTPTLFGTGDGILAMLKAFYAKEGLENLLYRNSPLLKKIRKERVEGKTANFSTLYSRGGAVSANFLMAKSLAKATAKAMEFQVQPGKLFSCCSFTVPELLASKTARGAYLPIAEAKMFASEESMRKTLALALFGDGYGYLCPVPATDVESAETAISAGGTVTVTLPSDVIMKIDIGTSLALKATKTTAEATDSIVSKYEVTKIDGQNVTIKNNTSSAYSFTTGDVICLAGCVDASGNPLLPVGLAGWLPTSVSSSDSFFGVNRSVARDRLAGVHVTGTDSGGTAEAKYKTLERAVMELRRAGSLADIIIVSDKDFVALSGEIEAKTYFTKPNGGAKNKAVVGQEGFGFSMSTSWVENVIDDPYCPEGTAYILDSSTIALWTFSNADRITNDGIVDNAAGKPDVTSADADKANAPHQTLVDDVFTVTNGEDTFEGPASLVATNLIASFVVTNPSVNAVVTFAN